VKVGDKVKMSSMWKYGEATGEIIKVTADEYIVVKWLDIPGEWHYTVEQAEKRLEVLNEGKH